MADARAAELEGFPTIFIGTQKFEGSDHTAAKLARARSRRAERASCCFAFAAWSRYVRISSSRSPSSTPLDVATS